MIPAGAGGDYGHELRVWRPDIEPGAFYTVNASRMSTELLIKTVIGPLVEKETVKICKYRLLSVFISH